MSSGVNIGAKPLTVETKPINHQMGISVFVRACVSKHAGSNRTGFRLLMLMQSKIQTC